MRLARVLGLDLAPKWLDVRHFRAVLEGTSWLQLCPCLPGIGCARLGHWEWRGHLPIYTHSR